MASFLALYDGLKAGCKSRFFERRASWREGKKQIKLAWVWKAIYHDEEGCRNMFLP